MDTGKGTSKMIKSDESSELHFYQQSTCDFNKTMVDNMALHYTISLNYLQRHVWPAEAICRSFRRLGNQQSTTVFGITRKGNKRMKFVVLVGGRLSVGSSHSEGGIWSVFENTVPRKIFWAKRDWRQLHNEELYDV